MIVLGVRPDTLDRWWPDVKSMLEPALELAGVINLDILHEHLKAGRMQLWVAVGRDGEAKSAAITEILKSPLRTTLNVAYIGGSSFKDWLKIGMDTIEAFASRCGCHAIRGFGRQGWGKEARANGYKTAGVQYVKDLK